jgi:3-dehydroquinate synthase
VAVITDTRVARRFGEAVRAALDGSGFEAHTVVVPPGERAKSIGRASAVIDALAGHGFDRQDTDAALGGGVVGDLAGFVAATYMRGVRLAHLPTTLLAQIDSSIGGKTAVNSPRAKNLIGVVHQPAVVVTDLDTLRSLPPRERRAGMAEAVKYGMILDRELFETLEREHAAPERAWSRRLLEEVVTRCATLKARVVEQDEHERGPREVFNYGHTVGHAVETAAAGRYTHGEAVAIGMRVEGQVARRLGLLSGDDAYRQDALLEMLGLPAFVPAGSADAVLEAMRLDKKRRDGRIRCTLPEGIGRAQLGVEVPDALMREVVIACQESG